MEESASGIPSSFCRLMCEKPGAFRQDLFIIFVRGFASEREAQPKNVHLDKAQPYRTTGGRTAPRTIIRPSLLVALEQTIMTPAWITSTCSL